MGTGIHGGFGCGTVGAKQYAKSEIGAVFEDGVQKNLIKKLKADGAKITETDVVFATRDKSGQIVWLETGNPSVGLNHILLRHVDDFYRKHHVSKEDIPFYLWSIFTFGEVEHCHLTVRKGRVGYEKIYRYDDQYYMVAGIGTNGFIISCYPIDSSEVDKRKKE